MDTAGSGAGPRTDPAGAHQFDGEALLEPGEAIGRFQITRVLGQGGMGVVYAARDPELGRELAVKVLHRSLDDEDERARARLLREARAMARVSHPNLVTIYDVGRNDGRVFIAMELVPGQTLGQWSRGATRAWTEVLDMYRNAGEGLLAAHEEGLVHRDFKPSNVLLSDKGRVQVLDFGLARATSADDVMHEDEDPVVVLDHADQQALAADLTRTGSLVGTPAYMAPEQFRGEPTDARTDQFSFCVALWEALFGERPFEGTTTVALMFSVTGGRIRSPPAGTEIPAPIVEALRQGLQTDPGHRFSGMRPLLERLRPSETAEASGSRRWGLVAAAGLLTLAGAGALAWAARPVPEPVPTSSRTDHDDPSATVDPPAMGLATLEGYTTRKDFRSTATRWRTAERDFARACEADPEHARHCAAVQFCRGQALLEEHAAKDAQTHMEMAAALDPTWALPPVGLASALRLQQRFDDALEASITAQGLDPTLWVAVSSAAATHVAAQQLDEAIDEYLRALEMAPDHPELLADLALVYHARQLDSQAERFAAKALAHDPQSMSALMLLAERALEEGQAQLALDHAERAIAVGPQSVPAWLARGDALLLLGRTKEAVTSFERAIERAKLDPKHGAPESRMDEVTRALSAGETPRPRNAEALERSRASGGDVAEPDAPSEPETRRKARTGRAPARSRSTSGAKKPKSTHKPRPQATPAL